MVDLDLRHVYGDTPEPLAMQCPVCKGPPVTAEAWQVRERVTLFHVIPISPVLATTWVKCPQCRQTFLSEAPLDELLGLGPNDVAGVLKLRASLPAQFVAVASILMCWVPIVGTGLALLGVALNWKSRSWTRQASLIGLVLSLLALAALFVLIQLKIIT